MSIIDDMIAQRNRILARPEQNKPHVYVNGDQFDALRIMAERYPDIRWQGPYCAVFTDGDGKRHCMYLPELIRTGREIAKWESMASVFC